MMLLEKPTLIYIILLKQPTSYYLIRKSVKELT